MSNNDYQIPDLFTEEEMIMMRKKQAEAERFRIELIKKFGEQFATEYLDGKRRYPEYPYYQLSVDQLEKIVVWVNEYRCEVVFEEDVDRFVKCLDLPEGKEGVGLVFLEDYFGAQTAVVRTYDVSIGEPVCIGEIPYENFLNQRRPVERILSGHYYDLMYDQMVMEVLQKKCLDLSEQIQMLPSSERGRYQVLVYSGCEKEIEKINHGYKMMIDGKEMEVGRFLLNKNKEFPTRTEQIIQELEKAIALSKEIDKELWLNIDELQKEFDQKVYEAEQNEIYRTQEQ